MPQPTIEQWAMTSEQIDGRIAEIDAQVANLRVPTIDDARVWLARHSHQWDPNHRSYRPNSQFTAAQYKTFRRGLSPLARTLRDGYVVLEEDLIPWALGQLGTDACRHRERLMVERDLLQYVLECRRAEAAMAMLDDGVEDGDIGDNGNTHPNVPAVQHAAREVTTYDAPNVTQATAKLSSAEERTLPMFADIDPEQRATLDALPDEPEE